MRKFLLGAKNKLSLALFLFSPFVVHGVIHGTLHGTRTPPRTRAHNIRPRAAMYAVPIACLSFAS
jgi:hypothetical protein